MFNLGTTEIVIILVVALLLWGPQQLPEIGKQIGKFLREFRSMSGDVQRALDIDGHHDYDRNHNRGSSFEYGYNDKTGYGVEHDDEPETKAFAYSAPTHGKPVAAIGAAAADADYIANDPATAVDEDSEPVETLTGARAYTTPVGSEAAAVKIAPSTAAV